MSFYPGDSTDRNGMSAAKTWQCGTLTYGKAGLAMIFAFLLWGDFCFTMMESVVPSILPLKFKALGAPNWLMGLCLTTMPGVMGMVINPWVSFKSDRSRTRWGRRIPFIFVTMPFLSLSLVFLGLSDDMATALLRWSPTLQAYAPATVTIGLVVVFLTAFKFFDWFVNSVFWYLFADVVPTEFLGRFMGAFRFVGIATGAIYNWFVFKHASTHMREIFVGVAILYFMGFGLMCLFVKEGRYPELEGETDKDNKGWGGVRTYFKECFSHKLYWYKFAQAGFTQIAVSIGVFDIFFKQEMGLTLDQVGKINALSLIGVALGIVFMAVYVDRWHPFRLIVYTTVFAVAVQPLAAVWLFVTLPSNYFFWINLVGGMSGVLFWAVSTTAALPAEMRLFPKSRFGQFCSAQQMCRNICACTFGIVSGFFIDLVKWLCHGSDFAYRYNFVWTFFFSAIGLYFLIKAYIEWQRLGGDVSYHPPAVWSSMGFEEMSGNEKVGIESRWLRVSFLFFDAIMVITTALTPFMMWWMRAQHADLAFKWYAWLILPLNALVCMGWLKLKKLIWRDIELARDELTVRNGVPHHGVLMLVGAQYLILLGTWVAEVIVTVSMHMESGAVAFGIGQSACNAILVAAIWLLCRLERGCLIDTNKIKEKTEEVLA